MSAFWIYLVGIAVVAGALAYSAYLLSVPMQWIGIGAAIVVGIGIMGAAKKLRSNDSGEAD